MKNRLKQLRERDGYTQDALARLATVSRQTINSIETEKYDPSIKLAYSLAKIFRCAIEDIFILEEDDENE